MDSYGEILTTAEVAKILNVSPERIRQLDGEGKLSSRRIARGMRLFQRADVDNYRRQRAERKVNG